MNKKISCPIAVIIIVLCAVLVGVIVVWQYLEILEERFEITGIKKPEETGEEIAKLNIPGNWYYAGGDTLEGYLIFRSDGILELPQGWFPEEENSPRWRYDAERELLIVSFNLTPNLFPEDEAIAKDFFGNIDYPWVGRFVDYNREDLSVSIRVSSETEAIEFFGWLFYKVKDETADWKIYTNSRVGYKFSYPSTNLTLALDETIKYPSTREGDSKTQDLVQFAVGETSFGIRTYVGEGKSTIESWIQEPNTPRAYHDLNKYEKVTVGGKTAYRIKGEAFVYVLANGNVYEITAYQNVAPVKVSDEPLFEKWVATIEFTK